MESKSLLIFFLAQVTFPGKRRSFFVPLPRGSYGAISGAKKRKKDAAEPWF